MSGGLRILLVDDHESQRALLRILFKAIGVTDVVEAGDADTALALASGEIPFDLVVSDLDMPGTDGMALARALRGLPDAPPVALLTAHDDRVTAAVNAMSRASDDLVIAALRKPVTHDQLRSLIERATQLKEAAAASPPAIVRLDEVQQALMSGEIRPYFEPLVDLRDGRIAGFEMLARWERPGAGVMRPSGFLPQIEHAGLGPTLTMHILYAGLLEASRWKAPLQDIGLSINVTVKELADPAFSLDMLAAIDRAGVDRRRITLEVSENAAIGDSHLALETLVRMRLAGCSIAIDDFGTGYSSMKQLQELPCTQLKIDHMFTRRLTQDPAMVSVVETTIDLARKLGLQVCAEGVESAEIEKIVRALGCEIGQGYYYAPALAPHEVEGWVRGRGR